MPPPLHALLAGFNLFEAAVWFGIGVFLAFSRRFTTGPRAAVVCAAFLFGVFGLSDVAEAATGQPLPAWLWIWKISCAALLFRCRYWYLGIDKNRFADRYTVFALVLLAAATAIALLATCP